VSNRIVNKMIIDREEFCLDSYNGEIFVNIKNLALTVKGEVYINEIITNEELNLVINILDHASLVYNRIGIVRNNTKLIINQNNNTKLYFKESFVADNNSLLKIENNILGNNNISEITVRTIAKDSNILVDATLNVNSGTENNVVKEDLRGLEKEEGKITIIPNMLVSSENVEANHNVTISSVREDELFYLTTKGLSEDSAKDLLEKGFLINIFNDENIKIKLKEIIN